MYLAFDTETGGLGTDVSLLTAYFAVLDKEFNLKDELNLKLMPDDGIYRVRAEALNINKIDIAALGSEAIAYKEARTHLYNFLKTNYNGEQLIPVGQNVAFDVNFIEDIIISKGSWDNFVSRRPLDTMYIAAYLKTLGKYPEDRSVSLGSLIEYFDIKLDEGVVHEAKYDTLATVEVLKKLIEAGK